ncbi:hypothetical protein THRCLA_01845 [Thraustotheca clavata]|uniref:RRM domain-containing protein n=1 Tax=Thraustotheca clavata TaxID=74557 RepID=A0A1W0A742_9STRA|nr:hypothetical protein THRCLA_01845 [Thraustotheca clavata]
MDFPAYSRLFVVCGRHMSTEALETLFAKHGELASVRIALDRSQKSRGFAFVQYTKASDAALAIEALHGQVIDGQLFKVSIAHASTPCNSNMTNKQSKNEQSATQHHGKRQRDDKNERHATQQNAKRCPKQIAPVETVQEDVDSIVSNLLQEMLDIVETNATKPIVKRKFLSIESNRIKQPKRAQEATRPIPISTKEPRKRKEDAMDVEASLRAQLKRANLNADTKCHEKKQLASAIVPPRSKLFVTSLYEYTHQELDAMFRVYGDFEYVKLVQCQGKLQTMAYVKYTKTSTALMVLESFMEDSSIITVSIAEEPKAQNRPKDIFPASRPVFNWLMVEYATSVSNTTLSDWVSVCPGMVFMDIQVSSDTKETKGIVCVKFASEDFAKLAINTLSLHQDIHSIQLIADPSRSYTKNDADLRAVESQFAHLMSTNPYIPPLYAQPSPYNFYPNDLPPAYPVHEYSLYASPPPPALFVPPLPKEEKSIWLHITSPTAFTANMIKEAVLPLEVRDVDVDGDESSRVFEASIMFADANEALLAIHTLTQPGSLYHVKLTQTPSLLRLNKKPKTNYLM